MHIPNPVFAGRSRAGVDPRPVSWERTRFMLPDGSLEPDWELRQESYTGSWYFVDEVGSDYYGPFATALEAGKALKEYAKTI